MVKNMFGQNTQIINASSHASLTFQKARDYSFARNLRGAPLSVEEILDAAFCFPVLFSAEGGVTPIAILGSESNNFVGADGQWQAAYVPVHVRRYPFILGKEEGQSDAVLMADLDSPQLQGTGGMAVFNEQGQLSPALTPFVDLLIAFNEGRAPHLLQILADEDLLSIQTLYKEQDEQKEILGQFRIVDESKLHALSDEKLAKLARTGVLALVYAHLLSMRHLKLI